MPRLYQNLVEIHKALQGKTKLQLRKKPPPKQGNNKEKQREYIHGLKEGDP